ncbi:hypothetical protein DAEQUDRAFT_358669 [Daedalea quercina L-15889]|uniref:Zinc-ribbon 15 domain-containing protein n=1 Tax=Daedalea quercina L-15889 TaxID=1314783 RepID=A0A165TSC1_9APHY|nr:hypothetical protein DAEQUDRAFT_358669 [Daedalea quercina L-15889]
MSDLDCGCCLLCSACLSGCVCLGSCMTNAFGCPSKVKLDKEQLPRICPECDDAAVYPAESQRWLRCFFLPVASLRSDKVWACETCDWQASMSKGGASAESEPAVKYPDANVRQPATHQPSRSREMNVPSSVAGRPSAHQSSRSRESSASPSVGSRPSIRQSVDPQESDLPNPYEMNTLPGHEQSAPQGQS